MNPNISVLMSVYNGEKYVAESIRSVLEQDFDSFEFLIIDDNSSDRTFGKISEFTDYRLSLYKNQTNQGLFSNLNRLLEEARGSLIKLWSQDDIMLRQCLKKGWRFFEEHPDVGYYYVNCNWIKKDGTKLLAKPDSTPLILEPPLADYYCFLHGNLSANISNLFYPRTTFDKIGGFKESYISADFDFAVRAQQYFSAGRIPEVLVELRQHSRQWSLADGVVIDFLREDIEISMILYNRLVSVYGKLTPYDADAILFKKFGVNYFHAAMKYLIQGKISRALRMFELMKKRFPLTPIAMNWIRNLPYRVVRTSQYARFQSVLSNFCSR